MLAASSLSPHVLDSRRRGAESATTANTTTARGATGDESGLRATTRQPCPPHVLLGVQLVPRVPPRSQLTPPPYHVSAGPLTGWPHPVTHAFTSPWGTQLPPLLTHCGDDRGRGGHRRVAAVGEAAVGAAVGSICLCTGPPWLAPLHRSSHRQPLTPLNVVRTRLPGNPGS
jgi:hypothetical protein